MKMNFIKKMFCGSEKPKDGFKSLFIAWLNQGLSGPIPDDVKAFSFNIYEPAFEEGIKFGIEIIGAGSFEEDDPDWPCDEIWEPKQRGLSIPVDFSGDNWEKCLEVMTGEVNELLSSNQPSAIILNTKPIGIGFVDGDLTIIKNKS